MENNKLGQEPAFGFGYETKNFHKSYDPPGEPQKFDGMSKRFYAACVAMQGMIQCGAFNIYEDLEKCIETSYKFADELLKQENS